MESQNSPELHSEFQFSSELQKEFQNSIEFQHSNTPQKQSPDIFSSQGDEEKLTELKIHNDKEGQASSCMSKVHEQIASSHRMIDEIASNHISIDQNSSSHRTIDQNASSHESIDQNTSNHKTIDLTASSHKTMDETASSHKLINQQPPPNHRLIDQTASNHQSVENSTIKSRLVDAMQRLEQESIPNRYCTHSNSVIKPSPFKHNSSVSLNDTNAAMDTSDCDVLDPKADMKKRVSRKITDYFGKKTI